MKRLISFFCITLFVSSSILSQISVQNYRMKALGANIGSLILTEKKVNNDTYYQTETFFKVNLLVKKVTMTINNQVHYKSGKLISVTNEVIVNGKLHSSSSTTWENGKYRIEVDGELKSPITEAIDFSGTLLYWNEPVNQTMAFSESSGTFMGITAQKEGKYHTKDPINNRNMIFFYENGRNVKVQVKHPLLTISMINQANNFR